MPDWSYHVLFKPLLFRLPPRQARDLTLGAIGTLANMPGGSRLIDFLGHMEPAGELAQEALGLNMKAPVGLGAGLNVRDGSLKALSRFGFGFVEVGPVAFQPGDAEEKLERQGNGILYAVRKVHQLRDFSRFSRDGISVPIGVRLQPLSVSNVEAAVEEMDRLSSALYGYFDYFVIDTKNLIGEWKHRQWDTFLLNAQGLMANHNKGCGFNKPVLLCICPTDGLRPVSELIRAAKEHGISGIVVAGGVDSVVGASTKSTSLKLVEVIKDKAPKMVLIASGGIHEPADALDYLRAGADFVQLHSGLIFSGPGLPKRINELVLHERKKNEPRQEDVGEPFTIKSVFQQGWLGFALLGAGIIIASVSAMTVGLTTVILPYDETFLGMSKSAVEAVNPHLLQFMAHDRVTFAGTAMSTGVFWLLLSYFGVRTGKHWAFNALRYSSAMGFITFMLFIGFHYMDPLHTFVNLLLLPFFFWGLFCKPKFVSERSTNLHNDSAWKRSLIGQFLFVGIGAGLILAGIVICGVGVSTVFVPEDLMFMHTNAHHFSEVNPKLMPVIAHDRASFGGGLATIGIGVLLTALHGIRQGEGWIWWMLLLSGLPGFLSTLGIHFAIGYTNWWHLLPAYIAFVMYAVGLYCLYPFLCAPRRQPD